MISLNDRTRLIAYLANFWKLRFPNVLFPFKALIIGIDRLLDMTRTAVNVTGDATISCVVASSEKKINYNYKE